MGTLILRWFLSKKVRQAVDMCRQVRKLISAEDRRLLVEEYLPKIERCVEKLTDEQVAEVSAHVKLRKRAEELGLGRGDDRLRPFIEKIPGADR